VSNLTSLTIAGNEWISKLKIDSTEYTQELGGSISTATFVVGDTIANINAIVARSEVIAYIGSTKVWGGYLAIVSKIKMSSTHLRATLHCQDYSVLMDRAVTTAEHVFTGTDEAALDTLFSTYCSAISTTPVNQVVANLEGLTVAIGTSVRRAVDMIQERSGAEWYVTPSKTLEYFDPASDAPVTPFWLRESVVDLSPTSWATNACTYVNNVITEDSTAASDHNIGATISWVVGKVYTIKAHVKNIDRDWARLEANAASPVVAAHYDLANGAIGAGSDSSARMIEDGSGGYYLFLRFAAASASASADVHLATDASTYVYTGDGTSSLYVYDVEIISGYEILRDSFSHSEDSSLLANDITVRNGPDTDESTVEIGIPDGSSDAHCSNVGASWPPGTTTVNTGATKVETKSGWETSQYVDSQTFLRFNTGAVLPADAAIISASLKMFVTDYTWTVAGQARLEASWVSAAAIWDPDVETVDYSRFTAAGDAIVSASYVSWTTGVWREWALSNVSNISVSGYTGLRIGTRWIVAPGSGDPNYILAFFAAGEHATYPSPVLVVTYNVPARTANDTDAASITAYGTQTLTLVDTAVTTNAEAALIAAVELAQRKNPMEYGSLETYQDGIQVGDLLHIDSDSHDVHADYIVRAVRTSWPDGICRHAIDYGDWRPDAIRLIRELVASKEQV